MPERIPQSVGLRVPLKAYLAADHVSNAVGVTLTVVISKNGAAFANPSAGATNAVQIGSGWYYVDLSTTDVNTLGPLIIRGTAASVDDVESVYQVVDANSMGAAYLDAAISSRNSTTPPTAAQIRAEMDTNSVKLDATVSSRSTYAGADTPGTTTLVSRLTAGRATNLDNLDATISGVPTGVWAATTRTLTAFGFTVAVSDSAGVTTLLARIPGTVQPQSGDSYARLGAPAGASHAADVAAVKTDTSGLRTDYTTARAAKLDNLDATVSSRNAVTPPTTAAISVAVVDQTLAGHTTPGTVGGALNASGSSGDPWGAILPGSYGPGTAGSILGNRLDATVSSRSTYGGADTPGTTTLVGLLTPARAAKLDNLDATITGVPAAVWVAPARTLTSFGAFAGDAATAVWAAATRTLTAFGFPVVASNALTGQQTANAVWDEPTSAHTAPGSTGSALASGSGGGGSSIAPTDKLTATLASRETFDAKLSTQQFNAKLTPGEKANRGNKRSGK